MRLYKLAILVTTILLLSWAIPSLYSIGTDKADSFPFTYYSSIAKQFCMINYDGNDSLRYTDAAGNSYTQEQFDSLLPLFYYYQLFAENRMPDTISGIPISIKQIKENSFYQRFNPSDISSKGIALYPLFESMGKRVNIEMPNDYFRFTRTGIEFIDTKSNSIAHSKSNQFTSALKSAGFAFPPSIVAGIPTTRKNYDEGYFILDNSNKLFHFKMVNGKPFIKNTKVGVTPKYIAPTDYPNRAFYGFMIGQNDSLYRISTPNYNLEAIPTSGYSPSKSGLLIMANPLYWSIVTTNGNKRQIVAVKASTLEHADNITYTNPIPWLTSVKKHLFPFTLSFISSQHKNFKAEIELGSPWALLVNLLLAPIALLFAKGKTQKGIGAAATVITGVFGLTASLLLLKNNK
ncbi:MAG: DUF4857 domain-containing protein [Bacteroidales bacterium]|nr:DUF4857 domain-containing protein [Bacteroidales bacterium]MBN2748955.1 DUF4857 domain-containing protein [Bacteroidales bacterium]